MAKIVVIDDSPITRAMISDFLLMNGHQVAAEAENLAQTLAAYNAHRPDLVTLDLSMGREDGFTILRALLAADAKVKVLIVSANTQPEIYDQLIKEGATGFIVKRVLPAPLSRRELRREDHRPEIGMDSALSARTANARPAHNSRPGDQISAVRAPDAA